MQIPYILIAVVSFLIILVVIVFINREKTKQGLPHGNRRPSPLATTGMLLVILAIIMNERWLSYSLIGLGVTLSVIDLARNLKRTKS